MPIPSQSPVASRAASSVFPAAVCVFLGTALLNAAATERTIEAEIRHEASRQTQKQYSPPGIEPDLTESTKLSSGMPTLHHEASDPSTLVNRRPQENESPQDNKEQRDWLLTGVLKLQGKYEQTLTDEERKAREERKRRYNDPVLFIDRMAALREQQRTRQNPTFSNNSSESLTTPTPQLDPLFESSDRFFQSLDESDYHLLTQTPGYTSTATTAALPAYQIRTTPSPQTARARPLPANPYLPTETPLLTPPNQPQVTLPSPANTTLSNDTTTSSAHSATPTPPPETRRYQPEKSIDELYFRNLRRF